VQTTESALSGFWLGALCYSVEVKAPLEPALFRRLALAAEQLRGDGTADGAVSAYNSLAVYWRRAPAEPDERAMAVERCLRAHLHSPHASEAAGTTHTFPVTYDGEDLQSTAERLGLGVEEVVSLHSGRAYVVAAIGFRPHFGYLWELDKRLVLPRLEAPRVRVRAGSLAIAGEQTAVYPEESPGGWRILGRVEPAFCAEHCPRLRVGDTVRFAPV
jgi:KipI family sensor histidine kinase inhibitor